MERMSELEVNLECISCEARVQVFIKENSDEATFAAHSLLSEAQKTWLRDIHECPGRSE